MSTRWVVAMIALLAALSLEAMAGGTKAGAQQAGNQANGPQASQTESAKGENGKTDSGKKYRFFTNILSGDAVNAVLVHGAPSGIPEEIYVRVNWDEDYTKNYHGCERDMQRFYNRPVLLKTSHTTDDLLGGKHEGTALLFDMPRTPCVWPPVQRAKIEITDAFGDGGGTIVPESTVPVSVSWFPALVTAVIVAGIYPGCAVVAWYIRKKRSKKPAKSDNVGGNVTHRTQIVEPDHGAEFWKCLDPVQITAGPYGRASLAKLQIFCFSLIVFGLMLFYLIRNGVFIVLSTDILSLLGISAVGAVGGKLTQFAKRRLSYQNWAWLRQRGWLPDKNSDFSVRAKWGELFTDYDNREFDVYSFQMAVFSLIVAFALIGSNLAGPEPFSIPATLLAILGLSQGVFIAGKAAGESAYQELDDQIDKVRGQEDLCNTTQAAAEEGAGKGDDADVLLGKFQNEARRAATMFWELYGDQVKVKPESVELAEKGKLAPEPLAKPPA